MDSNGSDGDWNGNNPYTIESESSANGWMIFDADGDNAGLPVSAYTNKKGYLTSPYIDLSNDSNVTLSFQHAYRWCCSSNHELVVSINDGTGWSNENSFGIIHFINSSEPPFKYPKCSLRKCLDFPNLLILLHIHAADIFSE